MLNNKAENKLDDEAQTAFGQIFSASIFENENIFSKDNNIFFSNPLNDSQKQQKKLMVGGQAFGIKFFTQGVIVVGMTNIISNGKETNPAYSSGIRIRDIITKIDGKEINTIEDFSRIINASPDKEFVLTVSRNNSVFDIKLKPVLSDDDKKYKIGAWIRDSTAGIGTITFIDTQNGTFGGLGHGIYDVDTGNLMPLSSADVYLASVTGAIAGQKGVPGELKGVFLENKKLSNLYKNTECGVFGKIEEASNQDVLPIASKNEIKCEKAQIRCTLNGTTPEYFDIEIISLYKNSVTETKNMLIKITDKKLLEITGGIVQGMSGSPIVQNGKLIGAVTHVLVNDPTKGYGIFIENMLKTA
ncbi:MAG: SpoIVB peptidase [Ruminococcaceae bacterium]|nr:SpoIVB peptidase [Oscillospiraceae bacterium]